jgi:hypothetical protein
MQVFDLGREREHVELLKTIKWPPSGGKKPLQQHKSEMFQLNLQLPGANYGRLNQLSSRVKS